MNCSKLWIKTNFQFHGGYLHYTLGGERKFVARFKRGGMGHFKSFLVKNFSPTEYFRLLDNGETPVGALETKGYMGPMWEKARVSTDKATRDLYDWHVNEIRKKMNLYVEVA